MSERKHMKENTINKSRLTKQTAMTVAMIFVSVFVISVATYAWFMITNTPKITQAEFVADTIGNLQISNATGTEGSEKPEKYKSSIGLFDGVSDADKKKLSLSPVTTEEGTKFYKPVYAEGKVSKMQLLDETNADEKKELHSKYIYEKIFFLRAGASGIDADKAKIYNIHLVGQTKAEKDGGAFDTSYGCFLNDKENAGVTAANAIRVSFVFENTQSGAKVIYEPNCDGENNGELNNNMLSYTNKTSESFGKYSTIKQNKKKSFKITGSSGTEEQSETICTIKEGVDIKVTMRIWIEGMDKDCSNDVAADKIAGQIQFISDEKLS